MLTATKEKENTAVEKALELFHLRNGFSFMELREPSIKAKYMRYGGDPHDNESDTLINAATKNQRKFFDKD